MLGVVRALIGKDLRLERRTPQLVPAMALFSLSTFVVFHFALQKDSVAGALAGGVLTTTTIFAAILGIGRLFVSEHEDGGFDGFLLAPVDRTAMLLAKAGVLFLLLVLVQLVAVPAFAVVDDHLGRADAHARGDGRNIAVHFAIYLNVLDDLLAVSLQSTVEIVQVMDT